MMNKKEVRTGKAAAMEMEETGQPNQDVVGDKGFEDVTDLKNEDFIYVY